MANTTGLGDTIYAAVKKAINDAEGSGGSGGEGSSDLTTAHVTVTSDVVVNGNIFQVCTFAEQGNMALSVPYPVGSGTTLEFDVILYKGGAGMMVNAVVTATSGAIQEMNVGFYQITGDCTITVAIANELPTN